MKEIKHYVCDICHTEYNDRVKATYCEKHHKKPVEIGECKYRPISINAKGYPDKILIKMSDGILVKYKLG